MRKTKIQDFQFVGSSGELLEIKRSPRVSRPLLDIVDKWRWHPLGGRSISSQEPTLFCLPNWKFLLSCLVVTHTPCVDISVKIDEGDAWVVQPWKKGDRLQQHLRPSLLVFQERHRWSSIEVFWDCDPRLFARWSAAVCKRFRKKTLCKHYIRHCTNEKYTHTYERIVFMYLTWFFQV